MSTSFQPLTASVVSAAVAPPAPDPSVPAEAYAQVVRLGLGEQFLLAAQLTRELFGDSFSVSIEPDPEIGNWCDVVFSVLAMGNMEDLLARNTQWHRRLPHTTTAGGAFCLSIDEQA